MSDYLQHLVQRGRNITPAIRPRPQALFEPAQRPIGLTPDAAPETETMLPASPATSALEGTLAHAAETAAAPTEVERSTVSMEQLSLETTPSVEPPTRSPASTTTRSEKPLPQTTTDPFAPPLPVPPSPPITALPPPDHLPAPHPTVVDAVPALPTDGLASAERPETPDMASRQTAETTGPQQPFVPVPATVVDLAPPPSLLTGVELPPAQVDADDQMEAPETPPTIQVTIGRVEVRATPAPVPKTRRRSPQTTVMSLDDYLRQRQKGKSP